ncbi:hypothetical protein [Marinilabilia sp.]|uniref:hypothetical protein n=1 Tax=Marinilabilia sp. TaxID=2021252 RepID=UPI0025C2CF2E|nr:hypothetical protein [Marinilabilia sp.]
MKRFIILLILLGTLRLYAQNEKEFIPDENNFAVFASFGQLIGSSNDEKGNISSLQITPNFHIGKYLALGLTTGVEWYDVALLPVGPDIKLIFPLKEYGAVYFNGAVGHAFPLEEAKLEYVEVLKTKGGRFAHTHLGYIFPMKGKCKLFMALGYQYQSSSHVQEHWVYRELERKIKYNRFSVRIGLKLF